MEDTFLDVRFGKNNSNSAMRVLIKRGDCFFIRNDIPHRGCENMSDFNHYRPQCHIEPDAWAKREGQGAIACDRSFGPVPTFDPNTCEYTNPLTIAMSCYWNSVYHPGLAPRNESERAPTNESESDTDTDGEVEVVNVEKV
jgi:hypothetical protein